MGLNLSNDPSFVSVLCLPEITCHFCQWLKFLRLKLSQENQIVLMFEFNPALVSEHYCASRMYCRVGGEGVKVEVVRWRRFDFSPAALSEAVWR